MNCTPVFNTMGFCGWVGMHGCLSTTRELTHTHTHTLRSTPLTSGLVGPIYVVFTKNHHQGVFNGERETDRQTTVGQKGRERERERDNSKTDRQTDLQTGRERERERERDNSKTDRPTEGEKEREREKERGR